MNADDLDVLLRAAGESAAAGDRKGAIAAYHKAIALAPERAELHYELGALLARAHRDGEALRAFAAAARYRPEWPEPWLAQGDLLFARGRYVESVGALEAAAARAPTRPDAWLKAAHALMRTKHWARAIPHLAHARELAPASEEIWAELRTLLLRSGRGEDADADFLRFDTVATPSGHTVVTGLDVAMKRGDPAREAACLERALQWQYAEGDEGQVALLLSLLQYVDVRQERLYAIYRTHDRLQQARSRNVPPLAGQRGDTELPVRIGYLSADFRADVLGKLLLPVVTAHDTGRFAVRAYSLAPAETADAITAKWQAAVDEFVQLAALDDRAAAEAIAADDLDLLVDLMGHSPGARPGILRYKPARVIATHLGYHGALGLSQVDYRITDRYADTDANARWQLEELLPLNVCALPLSHIAPAADAPLTRAALGIPATAIVFAAFAGVRKLSLRCIAAWRRILDAVPDAVLAFSPLRDDDRIAIERRVTSLGLSSDRLVWIPCRPGDDAFNRARYRAVDVALDTMPCSGGDTTAAALDAGVPFVARVGARHAERMSYSILMHLSLTQTIAQTDDGYVDLAVRLAREPSFRAEVRGAVARAIADPAATDPVRYARALEDAYARALAAKARAVA